ncbi:MAG: DUF6655 family protein [Alphaproteobacteria bacterium]
MKRPISLAVVLALALGACSTQKESAPPRTATEQLLISTAVDRAMDGLDLTISPGTKVFVNAENLEGTDSKYAVAAIRDRLLRKGAALVADRGQAQAVVEVRAGALSIDESETLIGIPSYDVPIPLASGLLKLPEVALYKKRVRKGVAKIAATSYGTADGRLIDAADPETGYSYTNESRVLLFFSWRSSDLPKEEGDEPLDEW